MSFFAFIIVFAVSWWIILFMLLPIGLKTPDTIARGHASSAPATPRIAIKMLWATLIAAVFTFGFLNAIDRGWFDFLNLRGV